MDGQPMELTVPVTAEQYTELMASAGLPGTVTHKVAIGPHYLHGVWIVQSGRGDSSGRREVTLVPLEES